MRPLLALLLVLAAPVRAAQELDVEAAWVIPGYNDVAIPGDTGTRLSLTDDLRAEETSAFRLRYGATVGDRHWLGLLVAPLTIEASGTLEEDVQFDGETFATGTPVDASFRFDSFRLLYRYLVHHTDTLRFRFGAALKVRDAAIELEGGGRRAVKDNTGLVPLLSFDLRWTPAPRWHLVLDGEALAAPQGRAEDVLLAVERDLRPGLSMHAGYRVLEGGADNDEVYTFSLNHYLAAGAAWSF